MDMEKAKLTSTEELFHSLSSSEKGLDSGEAAIRLERYGPNEISEKKVSPLLKFLGYFWGPIPWMIEIASALSAVIKHWDDFWIIMTMLLINAFVGFWQEHKAENAIELLKQKLALKARVLRDGKWIELPAGELVPGDVVRLRLGDRVPADVKLTDGDYLLIDESALTGESLPVERHQSDVGYAGSIVRQGEMTTLVVSTGMNTYFGKTARLVEEARTESHFQKAVVKIGNYLILLDAVIVTLIFIVAVFRHESMLEAMQFALVLTVAAIPVALPAVISVTLAIGAVAMAKKEAIVSKLVSIEEMAGMDVLCSDKTGTITKNEISVAEAVPLGVFKEKDLFLFGALASKGEDKDPIDSAILAVLESADAAKEINRYRISSFKPFDPVVKRSEATVTDSDGKEFKVAKGAPQAILALMPDEAALRTAMDNHVNSFAEKGYRSLAVARSDNDGWKVVGVLALHDPPRDDSSDTLSTAKSMGIKMKMVTGDHEAIAREVAKQVNLGGNIVNAAAFIGKSDTEAIRAIEGADGFARMFPEHKYHIVELLQAKGHIVGMTGDGVNDAPALKKADAGIAVAGATDAAKSAADIVLTKPGLSVIIDAVKESRKIFQRMNNYSVYRITETIRVLLFITLSIIVFQFYPVTALMIVLLAILNDAPIMSIAFDNVRYSDSPEKWDMRTLLGISTFLGVVGVASSFLLLYIGRDVFHLSREVLQSFIYLKLSVAGHLTVFVARARGHFWSIRPSLALFMAVVTTQIVATLITVYGFLMPAMGWGLSLFVWAYALAAFVVTDYMKVLVYDLLDHGGIIFRSMVKK